MRIDAENATSNCCTVNCLWFQSIHIVCFFLLSNHTSDKSHMGVKWGYGIRVMMRTRQRNYCGNSSDWHLWYKSGGFNQFMWIMVFITCITFWDASVKQLKSDSYINHLARITYIRIKHQESSGDRFFSLNVKLRALWIWRSELELMDLDLT